MAKKAWIENNLIFCAEEPNEIIPANAVEVPSWAEPKDLYIQNGEIKIKSETTRLNKAKAAKLAELKRITASLLAPTDWVVIKCTDLGLNMATAYPAVKAQRDAIRAWNDSKETAINNATTLSALENISLKYE